MNEIELKIGKSYYIWYLSKFDGKAQYMGLYYYVGCGQFAQYLTPLSQLLPNTPFKADIAVPSDNENIESVRFTNNSEIKIKGSFDIYAFRIDKKRIIDIESEDLNKLDWWNEYVEKYELQPNKNNK